MMRRRAGRISLLIGAAALVSFLLYLFLAPGEREGPALHFVGGAGEVGGSCLLVDTGDERFVVDCGSGFELDDPDPPGDCSFAIITHAHLDHCGRVPALFEAGFRGRVYCTPPTADLIPVMLKMSRGFERGKISDDAFHRALASLTPIPFDSLVDEGSIRFRFRRAGHLLGAAFVEIDVGGGGRPVRLVVSGDLGSANSLLVPGLEACERADYVVMESTYGGVVRDTTDSSSESRHVPFARSVAAALERGGDVLVPAFTLGRTQEVMAAIELFRGEGLIPRGTLVYVDSPTAHAITEIYRAHAGELSLEARSIFGGNILEYPALREVRSRTSIRVHERNHAPAIFISSSGNMDYANSPRHLMRMYADRRNLCCVVGYQAPGSTGAGLVRGDDPILVRYRESGKLREEWISPSLEVASFDSFSGHADHDDLIRWLRGISGVKGVFLVHGEEERSRTLAEAIERGSGLGAVVPARGEMHRLRIR
jgi:metallo-beta-lactamase family protein